MLYPVAYSVYSILRGALVGWYPYSFVDVSRLGYPQALANTAMVLLAFGVVSFCVVAFTRRQPAKTHPG